MRDVSPFADKINKIPEKKRTYVSSNKPPLTENGLERKYKVFNFGLKAETLWSLKQTYQLPVCVFSGRCTTSQKGSPP